MFKEYKRHKGNILKNIYIDITWAMKLTCTVQCMFPFKTAINYIHPFFFQVPLMAA